MKKALYGVLAALAAVLLAAVWFQRRGAVASVRLPDRYVEAATSVRFLYPDGSSFVSSDINKDFLHVLNLWEIDEIVSDSVARALRTGEAVRFTLRHNRKTLCKKKGYLHDGVFFLDAGNQGVYRMRCDYLSRTWPDFFVAGNPLWRNALLLNLDYFDIRRVAVTSFPDSVSYELLREDVADTTRYTLSRPGQPPVVLPTAQAQAYLTAFRQVYHDDGAGGCDTLAPALYSLRIETLQGTSCTLSVHAHDLFRALVITPTDTVLVPHVALDKIIAFTKL